MKLLVLCFIQISYGIAREWKLEDMNTASLIRYNGYEVEIHEVTTEDKYFIQMHRIPHNRFSNVTGRPVFLQHGLNSASDNFVLRTPEKDLAYILSDAGYDVWLGNSRGNPYSPGFVVGSNTTFWNFSYHEMGVFDLPAEIDYILDKTRFSNLTYIGHSLGGTIGFVLLSENPEYNNKINMVIGLSPASFLSDSIYFGKTFAQIVGQALPIMYQIFRRSMSYIHTGINMRTEAQTLEVINNCGENSKNREKCISSYMEDQLTNKEQVEIEYILPIKALHTSGTSLKLVMHLCQNSASNKFQKFDYGSRRNKKLYGVRQVPEYDLKSITTPIALFVAKNDVVATFKSNKRLAREFQNLLRFHIVNDDKFSHVDFLFAKDAKSLVYDDVLKVLSECIDKGTDCNLSSQHREELNIVFNSCTFTD